MRERPGRHLEAKKGSSWHFTSKELDEETGLYYYGARYYEPATSRWISPDPAGFELINPMDADGEPLADGWPEGFGPEQSGGMRKGYSVIEALNWYAYVSNNPVKYTDPTGMWTFSIGVSGQGGVLGGAQAGLGVTVSHSEENGLQLGGYASTGGGGYFSVGASINLDISVSGNDSIADTSGFSKEYGGTVGLGPGVGVSVNIPMTEDSESKAKPIYTLSIGLSANPGYEAHIFMNGTAADALPQMGEGGEAAATAAPPPDFIEDKSIETEH